MGLARTTFYCLKLRSHDKQSPERIQRIQQNNLRKMVRFAKEHSAFYRELYQQVDPDSEDFSVRSLPPVTKEMLMENFDRVVTRSDLDQKKVNEWARDRCKMGQLYLNKYVVCHTSGTTGLPATFVYDNKEWDWIQAFGVTRGVRFKPSFFQFFQYAGRILLKKVRLALVSVISGHFVTYILFLVTPKIGKLVSRFEFYSITEPIAELVKKLNGFDPNVLHCYPTMLEVLAHEKQQGRLHIRPWIISCSSEPLTPLARKKIEQAFPQSPVYETYGTTEGVSLGSECHLHRGIHVNSDYFLLESVREDGTPVEPGEAGNKLYLSCLFAKTMPILRYELNDLTIPLAEPCPCGLPFPLLKVRGRTDDIFWVLDKNQQPVALPPIPFEAMFLDVEHLGQYQLVQEERNRLRIFFKVTGGADCALVKSRIKSKMQEYLQEKHLEDTVQLEIEPVEQIVRDPKSGKIRQIYSKVERLYLPGTPWGERRSGEDRRTRDQKTVQGERRQSASRRNPTETREDT